MYWSSVFTCYFARFLWNVVGSALGNPQTPLSFFDFCQNWLPKYTGKDIVVIAIGTAALLWSIWKTRNKSCFQSSLSKDPTDIIFSLCSVLDSWGVLQKRGVQKTLKEVTKRLAQIARDVFKRAYGWGPAVRRLCWSSGDRCSICDDLSCSFAIAPCRCRVWYLRL